MTHDITLSRIKETEESAKKKLVLAEKSKQELIEESKSKSISLISEAGKKDNALREKEIQAAKEKINKIKQKLIEENKALAESIKRNGLKKIKSEPKFIMKKFSEEVL